MEIAAGIILWAEARLAFDDRVGGAGEVSGTTHQLRNLFGDGVDDDAGRSATGDVAILGGEDRQCIFPAGGQLAAETTLQLLLQIGMSCFVGVVTLLPVFLHFRAPLCRVTPETQ